jgi:hypothetical protein
MSKVAEILEALEDLKEVAAGRSDRPKTERDCRLYLFHIRLYLNRQVRRGKITREDAKAEYDDFVLLVDEAKVAIEAGEAGVVGVTDWAAVLELLIMLFQFIKDWLENR